MLQYNAVVKSHVKKTHAFSILRVTKTWSWERPVNKAASQYDEQSAIIFFVIATELGFTTRFAITKLKVSREDIATLHCFAMTEI